MEKEKYLIESNLDILSEMEKIEILGGVSETGNRNNTDCNNEECWNIKCLNTQCCNDLCTDDYCDDRQCVSGWPVSYSCM